MGLYIWQSYKSAHLLVRLAHLALSGSLYVGWYCFCTASWGRTFPTADSDYFFGYGVWRIADNQFENDSPTASTGTHAPRPAFLVSTVGWLLVWYGVFQAFASLAFMCVNLSFFMIVLLVYVEPCKNNAGLTFWCGATCIMGSIFWLVAVAVFGAKFDDTYDTYNFKDPTLNYSFYLAVIVCLFQLIAGILLLVPKKGNTVTKPVEA